MNAPLSTLPTSRLDETDVLDLIKMIPRTGADTDPPFHIDVHMYNRYAFVLYERDDLNIFDYTITEEDFSRLGSDSTCTISPYMKFLANGGVDDRPINFANLKYKVNITSDDKKSIFHGHPLIADKNVFVIFQRKPSGVFNKPIVQGCVRKIYRSILTTPLFNGSPGQFDSTYAINNRNI